MCANLAIYSTRRTVSVNRQQFHALASNEKSIGCDIIRRCTMGNKLRNYHTKRLPVPGTMAQPNRRTDWTAKARSARERASAYCMIGEQSDISFASLHRKVHYDSNPAPRHFRDTDALINTARFQPNENDCYWAFGYGRRIWLCESNLNSNCRINWFKIYFETIVFNIDRV